MQRPILKGGDARVRSLPLRDLALSPVPPPAPNAAEEAAGASGSAQPAAQPAAEPAPCETRLEVLRQDGVVVALEVHCACGELTRVALDYAGAPTAPADAPSLPSPGAHASEPEA